MVKNNRSFSIARKIRDQDPFSKAVNFNLDNQASEYKRIIGGCLYFIVMFITLMFILQQIIQIKERSGTLFTTSVAKNQIDSDYEFTSDDGLFLAVALIDL